MVIFISIYPSIFLIMPILKLKDAPSFLKQLETIFCPSFSVQLITD